MIDLEFTNDRKALRRAILQSKYTDGAIITYSLLCRCSHAANPAARRASPGGKGERIMSDYQERDQRTTSDWPVRLLRSGIIAAILATCLCTGVRAQGDALRRGISSMNASQPAEAEKILGSIPPSDRDYITAQSLLGYLYLWRSALPQAESAFRTVLNAQAENAGARFGLGMTLARQGRATEAVAAFEPILEDPSIGLRAKTEWIQSLFLAGRTDDAIREARRLTAEHHSIAPLHSLLGFLCQVRGDADEALHEYLESVELDSSELSNYFALISLYRSRGDWENALRWARRGQELDGNDPLIHQELAAIYEKLGRAAEADAARKQAGRLFDAEVLYGRAAKAGSAGRYREAESLLRESTARNPGLVKAWIDLGYLLDRAKRFEEARQAFQHALEISPGEARAVAGLTATLRSLGRESEALSYSRDAIARGSASPDVLAGMAAIYDNQGKPGDAEAAVMLAIRQLPDNPDLLSYLGYLRQSIGKTREALDSYSEALRLNPRQIDALTGQARSLLLAGNVKGALASLDMARSLDRKSTGILKEMLHVYRKAGGQKSAQAACLDCLAIDPGDLDCREQLAALKFEASDYEDAAKQFQVVLRSGTATKSVLDNLSFSLMKIGDYNRAIRVAEDSLRQFGPDDRVYAALGYLYRCRGDLKAAIRNYRQACDLAASNPDRNFDLGLALYLAKEYAAAISPFQSAIRLKPGMGTAHYYLAVTYWNLGQRVLALACARQAQELGVKAARTVVQSLSASLNPVSSRRYNR